MSLITAMQARRVDVGHLYQPEGLWRLPVNAREHVPPYRAVSVGERVLNDMTREQQLADADAKRFARKSESVSGYMAKVVHTAAQNNLPLSLGGLLDVARLANKEFETSSGHSYSGGLLLANAAVRHMVGEGNDWLRWGGSVLQAERSDIDVAKIATPVELLSVMGTSSFLLGVGSEGMSPRLVKYLKKVKRVAVALQRNQEKIKFLSDVVSVLSERLVELESGQISVHRSELRETQSKLELARSYRGRQGWSDKTVNEVVELYEKHQRDVQALLKPELHAIDHVADVRKQAKYDLSKARVERARLIQSLLLP